MVANERCLAAPRHDLNARLHVPQHDVWLARRLVRSYLGLRVLHRHEMAGPRRATICFALGSVVSARLDNAMGMAVGELRTSGSSSANANTFACVNPIICVRNVSIHEASRFPIRYDHLPDLARLYRLAYVGARKFLHPIHPTVMIDSYLIATYSPTTASSVSQQVSHAFPHHVSSSEACIMRTFSFPSEKASLEPGCIRGGTQQHVTHAIPGKTARASHINLFRPPGVSDQTLLYDIPTSWSDYA